MRNAKQSAVRGWWLIALPALAPAGVLAQPLTLQAPPTPATQPASADSSAGVNPLANPALNRGKILVLPFQPVNPNDPTPWLGKSIGESLVADLTVAAPERVLAGDKPAGSLESAIAVAKEAGARYVVAGGFMTVDRELRITGQVVDAETGKPVAGLKVTGDPSQVFRLEDALALQIRGQVLGQQVAPPAAAEQTPPVAQAPAPASSSPTGIVTPGGEAAPAPAQDYYSPYATAPAPVAYGADYGSYTYYPTYSTTYVSGYDPYYYPAFYEPAFYSPFCSYGYGFGCPFGFGIGFAFFNNFCHHDDFGHGFGGHGHDFHHDGFRGGHNFASGGHGNFVGAGRTSFNSGLSFSASARSGHFNGSINVSPSIHRSSNFRSSFAAPTRSPAFYQHGSFGHTSSIGGFRAGGASFHSFGGGSSFHATGGGGSFHGGGGFHGGGASHGGGGHR